MRLKSLLAGACLVLAPRMHSQAASVPAVPTVKETVTVLGAAEPVTEGESPRSVETIDAQAHPALVTEPAQYLRTDSSVDIQMRGPMGIQSDVAIRGGTYEQTLVLLNGLRVNDAQTSHFNLDVPVPLPAIQSIDVLHGAGSTLYGSDAVAGVVDLRTIKPQQTFARLRAGVGSYGINQQSFVLAGVKGNASEVLSGGREFSTGFIPDRDYRSESAASETRFQSAAGDSDVLVAASDRAFGADQFYGNYNSWERTKGWFAGLTQSFNTKTQAAVAYRRHSDVFTLFRNNPSYYQNNHIDESWQGVVRRKDTMGKHTSLFYGLEENTDQINSTNLGRHGRNRGAGYLNADLRWNKASLSAGLREEIFSGGNAVTVPSVSGSVWLAEKVKARGAFGYGYRIPTYTDLYYKDPTTVPNPNLKPEHAWNYEGGVDWYATNNVAVSATGFTSPQTNVIDYVRAVNTNGPYQARNLSKFRFSGAELSLRAQLKHAQQLRVSWTALTGAQSALQGLESTYVFNYASHNASAEWIAGIKQVAVRSRLGVTQRYSRDPYAVLDISAAREVGVVRPYLQMTNITNTGYQEINRVRMQGRAFVGGVEIVLH